MPWVIKPQLPPEGPKILRYGFWGVTHFSMDIYWSHDLRQWMPYTEFVERQLSSSNVAPCRSYKAFLRHLKKHPILKKVGVVRLIHRYVGYDIHATWSDE